MKILGLVPARKGSKRIPGKNAKLLGGKPLVAWTFEPAMACRAIDKVCLSTDDEALMECAHDHGVEVPFLRPAELCTDTATTIEVVLHALDHYERMGEHFDAVMLLQPTSPFRNPETLSVVASAFKEHHGTRDFVSVSPASSPPQWTFYLRDGGMIPVTTWKDVKLRSQDLEPAYALNGSIYLTSRKTLREQRQFFHRQCVPVVMESEMESVDIDTVDDWRKAEYYLSAGK